VEAVMTVVLATWIAAVSVDASAGKPGPEQQGQVFTGKIDAVVAAVSVRDRKGKLIQNLKKSDFEVIDSGIGRPIIEFYAGSSPVSLAVLLDISGSMGIGGNMDRARYAVSVATQHLRDS